MFENQIILLCSIILLLTSQTKQANSQKNLSEQYQLQLNKNKDYLTYKTNIETTSHVNNIATLPTTNKTKNHHLHLQNNNNHIQKLLTKINIYLTTIICFTGNLKYTIYYF